MKNFVFQDIFLTLGFFPHWNGTNPHWSLDHWNKSLSPDFILALLQTIGVVSKSLSPDLILALLQTIGVVSREPMNLLVCTFSHLWRRDVGPSESHSTIIELGIIPG